MPSVGDERAAIVNEVVKMLSELLEDWDAGPLTADTVLGTLGLDSVNLVYLIAELQQHYGLQDRFFKRLIAERTDIVGLRVDDVARYVHELKT